MDYDDLYNRQNEIDEEIHEIADDNGLNYEFEPMPDGVCDISAYLDSRIKILWILKEPYIKDITDDKLINLTGESGSREIIFL